MLNSSFFMLDRGNSVVVGVCSGGCLLYWFLLVALRLLKLDDLCFVNSKVVFEIGLVVLSGFSLFLFYQRVRVLGIQGVAHALHSLCQCVS